MKESTRETYEERIRRVLDHVQTRLDEPHSTEELAGVACFSPYHFHRIFRALTGESLGEYVRRLRLERAAGDLKHTGRAVTQIAFDAGYETHESFTRAFRAWFGMPPREYRAAHRAGSPPPEPAVAKSAAPLTSGGENVDVKIEEFPETTVAFVRHVGPYEQVGSAWGRLCGSPGVMRTMGPDTTAIGICYDDPDVTEADKIRYEACMTVPDEFEPDGGVEKKTIEGGQYAVVVHRGSYSGLHDTYRKLFGEWLPQSGREPRSAPALEVYRNNPQTTPEADLVTEIRVPLR